MRSIIASIILLMSSVSFAQQVMRISGYVATGLGADLGQYEDTMRLTRDQAREAYMNELVDAVERIVKASYGEAKAEKLIGPLMAVQQIADMKRDAHKIIDSASMDYTLSEFFKSEIERLYAEYQMSSAERKIEFIDVYQKSSKSLKFDHYLTLGLTHLYGQNYRVTLRLGSLKDGLMRVFDGVGTVQGALQQAALKLFISAHRTDGPAWQNPQAQIQLFAGRGAMSEGEAKIFCRGQNARIATAEEIITAQQAGIVRSGGINSFQEGEIYIIGDQLRSSTVTWSLVIRAGSSGSLSANLNPLPGNALVVCARGEKSKRQKIVDAIYSLRREINSSGINVLFFDSLSKDNRETLTLIEKLLINISAIGAESASNLKFIDGNTSTESILSRLADKGLLTDQRGSIIKQAIELN